MFVFLFLLPLGIPLGIHYLLLSLWTFSSLLARFVFKKVFLFKSSLLARFLFKTVFLLKRSFPFLATGLLLSVNPPVIARHLLLALAFVRQCAFLFYVLFMFSWLDQ